MRFIRPAVAFSAGLLFCANAVQARSSDAMLDECANVGKSYYHDYEARVEMKYNGQRVDGTHAVNGQIFLENRSGYFACSFDRHGRKMTEFFADGEQQNAYLPEGRAGDHGRSSDGVEHFRVTGVPGNDILNVRSGPSTRNDIVGALANGDRVRNLGCRHEGGAHWCHIQMLDEMRSEGWVNASYLAGADKSADPQAHVNHGSKVDNICAQAVAERVGANVDDVIVTKSTISEGTGLHVVYVGVPYGKADWICEADRHGQVVNVFYSGE